MWGSTMPAQNHVVIGIHGLSSKPPSEPHSKDWVSAICERLSRNFAVNVPGDRVGFELVYWADWLGRPAIVAGRDTEPYCTAAGTGPLPSYRQRFTDALARRTFDALADPVDWVNNTPPLEW